MDSDLKRLGKEVEAARTKAGLSAREVADDAGISAAYLRAIELGRNPKTDKPSRPSAEALRGIARALGIDATELLSLADYDISLIDETAYVAGAPARRAADDLVRQIQDAVKGLSKRSIFMYLRTLERLEEFTAEFQGMAGGTLRCSPDEEQSLTLLAVKEACRSHLRAVSYEDETWWSSGSGDRYLELHQDLKERGVEMTRIFIVEDDALHNLEETLKSHVDLGIQTFILSPSQVNDSYWRDFVIYDDVLLRTAETKDLPTDRKLAVFTDDPGRVAQALEDFKALHRIAQANPADAERVLQRMQLDRD